MWNSIAYLFCGVVIILQGIEIYKTGHLWVKDYWVSYEGHSVPFAFIFWVIGVVFISYSFTYGWKAYKKYFEQKSYTEHIQGIKHYIRNEIKELTVLKILNSIFFIITILVISFALCIYSAIVLYKLLK